MNKPMYEHEFHAKCPQGHKRNFVWNSEDPQKLKTVESDCIYCQKEVTFTIKRYWNTPKLLP
jgi:hypothetical protein